MNDRLKNPWFGLQQAGQTDDLDERRRFQSHNSVALQISMMTQNWMSAWLVLGPLLLLGSSGCSRDSEPVKGIVKKAPVSGVVTLNGEPAEGVEVYFYTTKFTGYATTNAEGKFHLVQGAAIGKNKVFFSKLEGWNAIPSIPDDPVMALHDPGQVQAAMRGKPAEKDPPKQLIPLEFTSETTSKLTFDVSEAGAKDANFNL